MNFIAQLNAQQRLDSVKHENEVLADNRQMNRRGLRESEHWFNFE